MPHEVNAADRSSMSTPATLLERLRSEVPDEHAVAWTRFVELYTPMLFGWARRMGCGETDSADLVQEVLVHLVRQLAEFRYDPRKSFRAWLRTVAHNCWRNLKRRQSLPIDQTADWREIAQSDPETPFWEVDYRRQLAGRALELMRVDFEEVTWKACWECVVEGRPAADVARELGIRVGTVYAAKSRVLSRLRQELEGLWE